MSKCTRSLSTQMMSYVLIKSKLKSLNKMIIFWRIMNKLP